jgi:hypothetical protein
MEPITVDAQRASDAEVRPAEPRADLPAVSRKYLQRGFAEGSRQICRDMLRPKPTPVPALPEQVSNTPQPKPPDIPGVPHQVSNRDHATQHLLLYVNGVNTTEAEAAQALDRINAALGATATKVVYNPREGGFKASAKVAGSILSTRLVASAEQECCQALIDHFNETLADPRRRTTVVCHSHGGAVVAAALARLHDQHQKEGRGDVWKANSERLTCFFIAPTVSRIVPGPQTLGIVHARDPVRAVDTSANGVAVVKGWMGWRPAVKVPLFTYIPPGQTVTDQVVNPTQMHAALDVMLVTPELYIELLSRSGRGRGEEPGPALAHGLVQSIRGGALSDRLHTNLIVMGCELYGQGFSKKFLELSRTAAQRGEPPGNEQVVHGIGNFDIPDAVLKRLRRSAQGQR